MLKLVVEVDYGDILKCRSAFANLGIFIALHEWPCDENQRIVETFVMLTRSEDPRHDVLAIATTTSGDKNILIRERLDRRPVCAWCLAFQETHITGLVYHALRNIEPLKGVPEVVRAINPYLVIKRWNFADDALLFPFLFQKLG